MAYYSKLSKKLSLGELYKLFNLANKEIREWEKFKKDIQKQIKKYL